MTARSLLAALTASSLGLCAGAFASTAAAPQEAPLWEREAITGNWGGLRNDLEDAGISFGGEYVVEYSSVWSGGVSNTASFRNLLTFDVTFDLETLVGLEGGTVFAQYLSVNPENGGSADSGDLQVYSNIENDVHLDVIYELWYEQVLLDEALRIKLGKVEANGEFAYVDAAGEFANSSAGFSPTVLGFPSYPDPATGVLAFYSPIRGEKTLTIGYGLFDGAAGVDGVPVGRKGPASFISDDLSDDLFHIGHVELTWERHAMASWFTHGRVSVGAWHHTGDFARFAGGSESGTTGFFATAETRVRDTDRTEDSGVYAFIQYGYSNEDVSDVAHHIGAGAVLRGTLPGRDNDSTGVYLSWVDLSDVAAAGYAEDEFAIDAYYKVQVTPAVYVQPELQYIINPSGSSTIDDALVAGVRVGVVF